MLDEGMPSATSESGGLASCLATRLKPEDRAVRKNPMFSDRETAA